MIRKKIVYGIALGMLSVMSSLTSCTGNESEGVVPEEFGTLKLGLTTGNGFDIAAGRAVDVSPYNKVENYKIEILKGKKIVQEFASIKDVPESIKLTNGTYQVRASYGTEHAMSRDEFLSQDVQEVLVKANKQVVSLTCKPTCAKVQVNFSEEMDTYFADYKVSFSTAALGSESAPWAKGDTDPWYLLVNPKGEEVKATIQLTPKKEYQTPAGSVSRTYTLKPNECWTLNVAPKYTAQNGQLGITITIDTRTDDIPVDIVVPSDWITATNE